MRLLTTWRDSNEVSKEGPLLTFKSELATFVWKETERPIERPQPASVEPAPSARAQLFGALVGGLIASRTTTDRRSATEPSSTTSRPRQRWRVATFPPPNAGALAFTIMPDGNPACASYDQKTCLWGVTDLDFSKLKPLVCGEMHRSVWSATGYEDPKHWCSLAKIVTTSSSGVLELRRR